MINVGKSLVKPLDWLSYRKRTTQYQSLRRINKIIAPVFTACGQGGCSKDVYSYLYSDLRLKEESIYCEKLHGHPAPCRINFHWLESTIFQF